MVKKQLKRTITPRPQKDPDWLLSDPEGAAPPPPVKSRANLLPFEDIDWKNFERLCRRLAECGGKVERAQAYGAIGQAQYGIDILVSLTDGTFEVWQTKRYRRMGPADIRAAVRLFLKHKWAAKAKKFVLAVACELGSNTVVDAIEAASEQLRRRSILFEPLGASQLTERLRTHPVIIDDFFDRPWVLAVCPPEALTALENRISRFTRKAFREALRNCYRSWIAAVIRDYP